MPEFKSTIDVQSNYTLPTTDGSKKELLETDGSGNADWKPNPTYKTVYNDTGSTITQGKLVRINGSAGAFPTIVEADNSTCDCVDGIAIEDIGAALTGLIQVSGTLNETWVNTSGKTAGGIMYLGTSGDYTQTKPTGSAFVIKLGKVGIVAPSSGSLLLDLPAFATYFEDLQGDLDLAQIDTTGASTNDVLTYDGTSPTWQAPSGGGTPAGSNGQIQFNNAGSFGADSDLFWDSTDNELGIGTGTPDAHITIEQPGSGSKEFLKINSTGSAGRPITLYDNGTFVGGIDYNFSGNYFSFDVTNATGTRITDAFVLMSESNDNFLGLGTNSPAYQLDVNGDVNIASGSKYKINGVDLNFSDLAGTVNLTTQVTGTLPVANGGTGGNFTPVNGSLFIGSSLGGVASSTLTAGEGIDITNGSGSITISIKELGGESVRPAFRAKRTTSGTYSTSETDVVFNSEDYDLGNDYNTSTGGFVAPVDGVYHFNIHLGYNCNTTNTNFYSQLFRDAGSGFAAIGDRGQNLFAADSDYHLNYSTDIYLDAGDEVRVKARSATSPTPDFITNQMVFSGHLVVSTTVI